MCHMQHWKCQCYMYKYDVIIAHTQHKPTIIIYVFYPILTNVDGTRFWHIQYQNIHVSIHS